jgi:aerobic-type carbon monoxide dehydrogenase small subunit (CoxS/CutS family)
MAAAPQRQPYALCVEPRRTLLYAIRDECGLTGTHTGCEHGICGACTMLVDDDPIPACLMFAHTQTCFSARHIMASTSSRRYCGSVTGSCSGSVAAAAAAAAAR